VTPSAVVRDLGIILNSDMSMSSHVRKTVSTCFAVLRQLRSLRRQCPDSKPAVQSLMTSLVLSRLETGRYSSTSADSVIYIYIYIYIYDRRLAY